MIAQAERRRGMDELWEKMGEVRAGQIAHDRRLDALAVERQQQHVEAIKALTDSQAQYHEIKHSMASTLTNFAAIDRKMTEHQADDKEAHQAFMARLDELRGEIRLNRENLQHEIVTNRGAGEAREQVMLGRIDDLFASRYWLRGVGAVGVMGLAMWGHDILEAGKNLFHWGPK